ncbi:phospho-sugar mutase [Pontibacter sp. BT310]|uniref:Phospho-sugar mutase n=1 Tax=Pontibacter populi TaxID=890055 RepID=A0ABS6XBT2_9BACT|nr:MULTISPECIES: phospho-sugar mutase [Pontibacter]MBJ6118613.1 phospho-sugar mutase [Pontibacter sp. BT310]MBR0571042.1 phospho-sugar mutase [Microvirga sp. STS03]MBW3365467.1 phospho-sugar mutase [Pontibacter populi]
MIEPAIQQKINSWLSGNYDEATKTEINGLLERNEHESLSDAFYKDLEFGTGGLRGIMGAGSNRMNRYTLGMATQGLCNYLKQNFPGERVKVAIAHDSRNNSPEFARIAADIFSANDIEVYLFQALRPTPQLSFAIRHLGCQSGVVVTASHNPKEYNGYKVYWNDGAQVTAPHDKNIIAEVNKITSIDEVKFEPKPNNIHLLGPEMDEAYITKVLGLSVSHEAIRRQHDLKIVYTPLHGTGITLVPEVLQRFGFSNVTIVDEQAEPNGNFPTVVYPNPEEKEAMTLALNKAIEIDADLVMATDPDSDRVGIAVRNLKGEFVLLNGNQTGALLINYLLQAWQKAGKLTGKEFIVKTIVTTDLIIDIAESYGVKHYETLTGFKYIAEKIREVEGKEVYIGGGEESYGYMIGDFVRDKDGISACALIAEMAAVAKDNGQSLFEMMVDMYEKYNFYKEELVSFTKKGQRGAEEIQQMMADMRANPPQTIAGSKVVEISDFKLSARRNLVSGEISQLGLESSNVLQYMTEDGSKISARPSGTEPKIKFYISVNEPLASTVDYDSVEQKLNAKIEQILVDLKLK